MFPCLKLKKLEEHLQAIEEFESPKVLLEQYITPSHLGSHMLYTIQVSNLLFVYEAHS
nr:unnamed protein product [Callosobruchus analis]